MNFIFSVSVWNCVLYFVASSTPLLTLKSLSLAGKRNAVPNSVHSLDCRSLVPHSWLTQPFSLHLNTLYWPNGSQQTPVYYPIGNYTNFLVSWRQLISLSLYRMDSANISPYILCCVHTFKYLPCPGRISTFSAVYKGVPSMTFPFSSLGETFGLLIRNQTCLRGDE